MCQAICEMLTIYILLIIFRIVPKVVINIPISEMKKLRFRRTSQTSRFLHVVRWQSWDCILDLSNLNHWFLPLYPFILQKSTFSWCPVLYPVCSDINSNPLQFLPNVNVSWSYWNYFFTLLFLITCWDCNDVMQFIFPSKLSELVKIDHITQIIAKSWFYFSFLWNGHNNVHLWRLTMIASKVFSTNSTI